MADSVKPSSDRRSSSPASAANSDATTNPSRTGPAVPKDRDCPFCHQSFTSSSLGRHLDTFIRDRNPKPPDGIHNVAEIRKIRSAITRRHARVSSHTPRKHTASPAPGQRPLLSAIANSAPHPSDLPPQPVLPRIQPPAEILPAFHSDRHPPPNLLNRASWTATGVINNLPPRTSTTPVSRDLPFPRPDHGAYKTAPSHVDGEERRNAQAVELALKEVLRTVHDAAERIHRQPLFDYDFFALNFPALCLRILSPPPTLFSSTPQSTFKSWPLNIPTRADLETTREVVDEKIRKREHILRQSRGPAESTSDSDILLRSEYRRYFDHLDKGYVQWSQLPDMQQHDVWRLEILRAFADESAKRKVAEQQLELTRQELEQFRSQYRSPHSALYRAPSLPQMAPSHLKELVDSDINLTEWDFDRLIAKWKSTIPNRQVSTWAGVTSVTHASPKDFDAGTTSGSSATYRPGYGYTPNSGISDAGSPAQPDRRDPIIDRSHATAPAYDNDVQMQEDTSRIPPKDPPG